MHTVQLEHVTFIRNNRRILDDVTITFPPGKTSVVIGPSGCGKSTLLKVSAGLFPPTSGKVTVDGHNLLTLNKRQLKNFRRESSFVFQDAALWANKSVYDNVHLPLQIHFPQLSKNEMDTKILGILKEVGYTDSINLRPAQLSNGERKMVSLARALVTSPDLIYMDNPLILVDPSVLAKMRKLIVTLHDRKETVIANFSSVALTKQLTDFAAVMKDGKIIFSGSMEEVLACRKADAAEVIENIITRDYGNSV